MFPKNILFLLSILLILIFLFQLKISKSLTSSSENYFICIGEQGSLLYSQNYNLLLSSNSPIGNSSSLSYKLNLGFVSECIEGTRCNLNSVCEDSETQENCPTDCFTEITIIPSQTMAENEVYLNISFSDSRYKHEIGTRIKVKLFIGSTINWNVSYDCFSDLFIILTSAEDSQTCDWEYGKTSIRCGNYIGNMNLKYFSSQNRVELIGKCKMPSLPPGYYTVDVNITIYLTK